MSSLPTVDLPRGFEDLRGRAFNHRYSVSEVLSVGRSHVVFGATDRKGAGQVLLRLMRPSVLRHPPTVERFKKRVQDARRASSLRARPSIDAGEGKDGKLYLVCKRPPGRSLRQYVAEHEHGRLPWPVVKRLLQSFIEVLKAAHDRRIVHGGLMPDSFWIEEVEGSRPVAYVIDLGANPEVLREEDAAEAVRTTALTADMEFTAPETITGASYDQRTDVYLLGLIAYFMLTGRPPFRGKNHFQVASEQVQRPVPSVREEVPGIPEEAEGLLGRMLAKDASERPQTMAKLERELAGVPEVGRAKGRGVEGAFSRPVMPPVAFATRPLLPVAVARAPVEYGPAPTTPVESPTTMPLVQHGRVSPPHGTEPSEATEVLGTLVGPALIDQGTETQVLGVLGPRPLVDDGMTTESVARPHFAPSEPTVLVPTRVVGRAPASTLAPRLQPEQTRTQEQVVSARPSRPPRRGRGPSECEPGRPAAHGHAVPDQSSDRLTIPLVWLLIACGVVIVGGIAVGLWLAQ